ncbi:DNA alkylation repair protein [bacterium LRH843]|nr:DNA alkylation repair protein [bacterium LRH843]
MTHPYLCPNCKTNRSRFNLIEQVATPVKLDSKSGDIVENYTDRDLDPFHLPYRGPSLKVQCAVCGLIEDERMFIKRAQQ